MRFGLKLRFWMFLNWLLDFFYKTTDKKRWPELKLKNLKEDFWEPFKKGHLPKKVLAGILEDEYILRPPRYQLLAATYQIVEKVKDGLYDLPGKPYRESRILKNYASALLRHFDSCEDCQQQAIEYYAFLQQIRLRARRFEAPDSTLKN